MSAMLAQYPNGLHRRSSFEYTHTELNTLLTHSPSRITDYIFTPSFNLAHRWRVLTATQPTTHMLETPRASSGKL